MRRVTSALPAFFFTAALVYAQGFAQTASEFSSGWKRVAGTTISEGFPSPATGPVRNVWYSAAGARLLVRTAAGRVFETSDYEHWRLNVSDAAPTPPVPAGTVSPLPEPGARIESAGSRLYAAGHSNVYAWDDTGRTWLNLTGFNDRSVIGGGFTSLAVSPANSREVAVANQFGVWRSLDGGLSWRGLNENLPNLPARHLVNRRTVSLADSSLVTFESGAWVPAAGADPESALRRSIASRSGLQLSAATQSGSVVYGATADGRLFVSRDGGNKWNEGTRVSGGAPTIERIWVDPDRPDSALAAAGPVLLRTVNGGAFWDNVTGALPEAVIHGIAADRSAGAVYLATDRGVFAGNLSLNDAGPAASGWKSISRDLEAATAWDVRLNADNTLTVVLDGYGVFEAPAPHRTRNVKIVNGADMSDRAAAPGSLISVLGANVRLGRAGTTAYPVIVASDQSSQLQVPFDASAGVVQIALEGNGSGDRWTLPLNVKDAAPAIFVDADGAPLVLDSLSGFVVDPNVAVHAGSSVQILTTGLGRVTPDWPTGTPAPVDSPPSVKGSVSAWIDGSAVQVTRATLAPGYVGYYLVELKIPAIVNRGASELRIVMNGEESNRVKLYLEPDLAAQ